MDSRNGKARTEAGGRIEGGGGRDRAESRLNGAGPGGAKVASRFSQARGGIGQGSRVDWVGAMGNGLSVRRKRIRSGMSDRQTRIGAIG